MNLIQKQSSHGVAEALSHGRKPMEPDTRATIVSPEGSDSNAPDIFDEPTTEERQPMVVCASS